MPSTRPARPKTRISSWSRPPKCFHQSRFHSHDWNGDAASIRSTTAFQSGRRASKPRSSVTRVISSRVSGAGLSPSVSEGDRYGPGCGLITVGLKRHHVLCAREFELVPEAAQRLDAVAAPEMGCHLDANSLNVNVHRF